MALEIFFTNLSQTYNKITWIANPTLFKNQGKALESCYRVHENEYRNFNLNKITTLAQFCFTTTKLRN